MIKMNFTKYLSIFLFSMALLIACSEGTDIDNSGGNNVGNNDDNDLVTAPSFSLQTTSGQTLNSSDFAGKNLVIFFFGYNCPPCKSVGPNIESKINAAFKGKSNFAIIGADQWDGNNAGVDQFRSTTGITFPLGVKGSDMARAFGTTYDRLVVINENGKIVFKGNRGASNNLYEVVTLLQDLVK